MKISTLLAIVGTSAATLGISRWMEVSYRDGVIEQQLRNQFSAEYSDFQGYSDSAASRYNELQNAFLTGELPRDPFCSHPEELKLAIKKGRESRNNIEQKTK